MSDPLRTHAPRGSGQAPFGRFASRESARSQQGDYPPILPSSSARAAFSKHPVSRRLIIAATPKGGVGKSFFLINLADWLAEKNLRAMAFDTDWSSATLTRFQPETRFLSLTNGEGFQEILQGMEDADLILVDGSAASIPELVDWVGNNGATGSPSLGEVGVTFVCFVEEDKDTVFQAGELCRRLGASVDWLIVRSLKTSPATEIYDNSKTRQELLRLGAGEITVARLPWNLLSIMQRTSKSLSGLLLDKSLSLLERHRLRSYQERLFEQFAAMESVLLPRLNPHAGAGSLSGDEKGSVRPRIAPEEV
ncbi:MAG: hypothetical protein IAE94_04650 [Chthoniobacterales bacterium]|nr:hypothetical protein [Chthoniobacterales bacterium]